MWDSDLRETQQANLVITPDEETDITVDNLEVAQFIYLILNMPRPAQPAARIHARGLNSG